MASKISEQLTKETGIDITFETVRGSWKEGIYFFLLQLFLLTLFKGTLKLNKVKVLRDPFSFPPGVDRNVSAIELDIEELSVKLSLMWWIQGNGFIEKMAVNNVKGKIERSHLVWPDEPPPRRKWQRGDFVFQDFKLKNVDVNLYQLTPNRPLRVQIHSIDCGKVRKQWLLRDLLSSHSAYGIFDGSLFSLTRINSDKNGVTTHLKIDGLNLDLISASVTGPMAWIKEGTFDVSIKMNFNPVNKIESGWTYYYDPQTNSGYYIRESLNDVDPIVFDVKLKLNNLRAKIPSNTENLSYFYRALAYPVVAYMNANYTCIPLKFKIIMSESQYDGAWFPYDAGIWDALSIGVTQEFVLLLQKQKSVSNLHKHIFSVLKSLHRGIYFLGEQIQGYYDLWYFNNDDETPEDLYKI